MMASGGGRRGPGRNPGAGLGWTRGPCVPRVRAMRLLLIEDSSKLVDSLRTGLTRSGYQVVTATDGETGRRLLRAGGYEIVVLDLMLPGVPGLELLTELRARGDDVHVLVLTALDAVEDRVRGLQVGADDYLVKPFSFDELLARLQALTRRRYGAKRTTLEVGDLEVDTIARRVRRGGGEMRLSPREYRLLEFLALRADQTVTREEIEEHLYGSSCLPLSNAVDSAICSLRSKLKRHGDRPLIHTRPRLGYVLSDSWSEVSE